MAENRGYGMEFLRWVGSTLVGALTVLILVATFGWARITEMVHTTVQAQVAEAVTPLTAQIAASNAQLAATNASVTILGQQLAEYMARRGTDWESQREANGSLAARMAGVQDELRELRAELRTHAAQAGR